MQPEIHREYYFKQVIVKLVLPPPSTFDITKTKKMITRNSLSHFFQIHFRNFLLTTLRRNSDNKVVLQTEHTYINTFTCNKYTYIYSYSA